MLNLEDIEFRYEPYPIGLARPVMAEDLYWTLARDFPPVELFEYTPGTGRKYSLSEKNNPKAYRQFIRSRPHWSELHAWLKSREFVEYVIRRLEAHRIDVALPGANASRVTIFARTLAALVRAKTPSGTERLRTRFEFSALPADGGFVRPHTDSPKKRITLVVSMTDEADWKPEYGGSTDVNRPIDPRHAYNWRNDSLGFEEVEVLDSYPFEQNQCILFVKTFNSLHSVPPMRGIGSQALRRTLTINLEIEH